MLTETYKSNYTGKGKKKNYKVFDAEGFYDELCKYYEKCIPYDEAGEKRPKANDIIGNYILSLVKTVGFYRSFINYNGQLREAMMFAGIRFALYPLSKWSPFKCGDGGTNRVKAISATKGLFVLYITRGFVSCIVEGNKRYRDGVKGMNDLLYLNSIDYAESNRKLGYTVTVQNEDNSNYQW